MCDKDIEMVLMVGTALDDDSIFLLNRDVDREIKKRKKEIEMLERLRSVRVVLGDDETVVTAYHTHKKIEKNLLRGTHRHAPKPRCHINTAN
jgi:hypothetical protein